MPLKRPTEKKWTFKQPEGNYPQCPTRGLFLGPSQSGKSTTWISLLVGPYSGVFDAVHVISPSAEVDSAYDVVREHVRKIEGSVVTEWDEAVVSEHIDLWMKHVAALKRDKTHKPLPQVLFVLDDLADRGDIMHKSVGTLTSLMIRGRHAGINTWISSQKLTALSLVARVNLQFVCVWKLRNQRELDAVIEELSALYPRQTLLRMYHEAVRERYSFWYVPLTAPPEQAFHVQFDERLVVKRNGTDEG